MSIVLAFVRLSRLHFLLGGFLMFAMGALTRQSIQWPHYVLAQCAITAAQLTAHYLNEYADFEADKAVVNRTAFSGGSGILVAGTLRPVVALRAGQVTTVVAIIGGGITATFSIGAAITIGLAVCVSWAYSMEPLRLLSTGWGELLTAFTVAGLVPLTGALAQNVSIPAELWWLMSTLVCLQVAMLLAFELPDLESDRRAGKLVLGVRLAARRTSLAISGCVVLAVGVTVIGWVVGDVTQQSALLSAIGIPFAALLVFSIKREQYARMTFAGVATFFLVGAGFTAAEVFR